MTARSETPPAHGSTDLRPDTVLVAGGRPAPEHDAPVGPSIVLTSTYRGSGGLDAEDRTYGRFSNPTWEDLEDVLARLERAELPALAYASGLAAVASVLSLVPAGGRLVLPRHSYQGSLALAADLEARGLLTVRTVDVTDTEDVVAALDAADLLWLESPTNPMLEVADLPALLAAARERGVLTCVDNTFATPLLQRPLEHGADIVVHSVTKYLAGHSDVVLGAAVTSDPALRTRLKGHRSLHGAVPGPFEAWLALRGMRTLAVRVERSAATAGELARRLQRHPAVREVRYPGLPGDPGHARAAAQMDGFGSIVAIVPAGDVAAVEAAVDALRVWTPATSLGGVESLIERRRRHHEEPHSVPETLLRLSVGIENVEDLWEDLDRVLCAIDR
ncbi:trans-sulfuration enzyme family protein [Kocuria rosea]|uniref:trans-sulfuration enzyme family protein n=1 Tax=Kocuria rosea TaxID=1275 RepID=UPI0011A83DEF|nr:aminotransferase class I/II-fold pyridoxal phosphate-dependent enzyme [Kocuria rosea]